MIINVALANEVELQISTNSKLVSLENKSEVEIKANESTKIKLNSPSLLTSESMMPVLLSPVYSGNANIKLDLVPAKDVLEKIKQEETSKLIAEVLPEVIKIQGLIRGKQIDRAGRELEQLQVKFPDIKFLNFLKASIVLLKGKRAEAEQLTAEALKFHPEYEEGKKFLQQIKGDR